MSTRGASCFGIMSKEMKRLVLIDGFAILHRAYHAFPKSLTTRSGELVNAVYGFTRMLLKAIEDLNPKYLIVAFDTLKPTFRHKEFIGYQAQRPKMDEEMENQLVRVKQVLEALGISSLAVEGYEADDIIGTLVKQAGKKKVETVIVTGDKDIMQLVEKTTRVYAPVRGFSEAKLFGKEEVKELLGIKPNQIVDYKAMVGDPSDNYPGVPGIGPKTAVQLLKEYGRLEEIYKNIKKIKPLIAHKLMEGRESAMLSRKLATIVRDAPVELDLKKCEMEKINRERGIKIFEELEFKSLVGKFFGEKQEEKKQKKEEGQIKLF